MKALATGFGAFLENVVNPTEMLLKSFAGTQADFDIRILPVGFRVAFEEVSRELAQYDFVLMLGLASKRSVFSLERVALNWCETEFADNFGVRPPLGPIIPEGPEALINNLDLGGLCAGLRAKSHPIEVSSTAGTYVCNDLYFRTLYEIKQRNLKTRALFVHVPPLGAIPLEDHRRLFLDLILALGFRE